MRALQNITRILVPIGAGALLIMTVTVTINVLGRAIFGAPVYGSVEVVELTSIILVSLIISYTQITKSQITVNILVDRFAPRARAIIEVITLLLSAVVILALVWAASIYTVETAVWGETTYVFEISTTPFRAIWVFGLFILLIVIIGQMAESLGKAVKK